MHRAHETLRRAYDELASAISEQVCFDKLSLHLAGRTGTLEALCTKCPQGATPVETVIFPLFSGGRLLGRLHATRNGVAFTREEREQIRAMARLVAAVCVGMTEAAASEERLGEAAVLLELARATADQTDPLDVAERASAIIARLVPPESQFGIFVLDEEGKALEHFASQVKVGEPKVVEALRFPLAELRGQRRRVFETGRTEWSGDALLDVEINDQDRELAERYHVRSMLSIAIRAGGESLGLLEVSHPRTNFVFADSTLGLLQGIANQLAATLRNATLARESSRRLEELRAISRRLWSVQEEERRRIARELHDEAGQAMTALKLNLDLARREDDSAKVKARLADAVALAGNVLEELRRIARDLRPASLDDLGLVPALRALVDGFGARTGIKAAFSYDGSQAPSPDSDAAATTFRFVQEGLTNVARHAHASWVAVRLKRADSTFVVEVEDDGVGITGPVGDGRLGLVGMRERARLLGGRVVVETGKANGRGTTLVLEIPAPAPELRRGDRP